MDKEDLKTNRFLLLLLAVAMVAILIIAGGYFLQFGSLPNEETSEHTQNLIGAWGTVGDYFGGTLNPILAFCSLLALCYTISLQNKQLKKTDEQLEQNKLALEQNKTALEQNAKALEFNNQELKNSNEQLRLSAQAQAEMEKTQRLQRFEGLFTYMANELEKIHSSIYNNERLKKMLLSSLYGSEGTIFKRSRMMDILRSEAEIARFFIYFYQILKFIDSQDNYIDKIQYSNIIHSSLDNNILLSILLNCLVFDEQDDNFIQCKYLIEKYSIFQNISFENIHSFYFFGLLSIYDIKAFNGNVYINKIVTKILGSVYNSSNDLIKIKYGKISLSINIDILNKKIIITDIDNNTNIASFNLYKISDIQSNYEFLQDKINFTEVRFIYITDNHQLDIIPNEKLNDVHFIYKNLATDITHQF